MQSDAMALFHCISLAILLAVIQANEELNIDFHEGSDDSTYTEKVLIKGKEKSIAYQVPDHGSVEAVDFLADFKARLNIEKDPKTGECIAYDMDSTDGDFKEASEGIKQVKKFPHTRYVIENLKFLPVGYVPVSQITDEIRNFCPAGNITKVMKFSSLKEMQAFMVNKAIELRSNRPKRNLKFKEFPPCVKAQFSELDKCFKKYGYNDKLFEKNLKASCKITTNRKCIWKVICSQKNTQFTCVIPDHMFSIRYCCDYLCL